MGVELLVLAGSRLCEILAFPSGTRIGRGGCAAQSPEKVGGIPVGDVMFFGLLISDAYSKMLHSTSESSAMKFLFVTWTVVRNAFEAAVWATVVRTLSLPLFNTDWIYFFWAFFAILFVLGLGVIGTEPWLLQSMLVIDPMLVGSAILQAVMCALIPTIVTIVVASLVHAPADWLQVFLFFACGFYILWRRSGKKKAVQSWKGEPKPEWKTSDLFKGPTPVDHLPEWQRAKLTEHRQQRSSLKVEVGRGVWTRAPDRSLVTELELYWAEVSSLKNNKIGFAVYSKKSGQMAQSWFDYDTEKQAMDSAVAWMRHGKSPNPLDQSTSG